MFDACLYDLGEGEVGLEEVRGGLDPLVLCGVSRRRVLKARWRMRNRGRIPRPLILAYRLCWGYVDGLFEVAVLLASRPASFLLQLWLY